MLAGAGRCFVGGKKDREFRELVWGQLPFQALAMHQLGFALRREPSFDLTLGY